MGRLFAVDAFAELFELFPLPHGSLLANVNHFADGLAAELGDGIAVEVGVDVEPRHPGQLYEALAYFCFIFVMLFFYLRSRKKDEKGQNLEHLERKTVGSGFFFGLVLTLIFTFRFFIEYTKDIQVDFESGMLFNMGQLLSIPFIIIGIASMIGGKWMKKIPGAK